MIILDTNVISGLMHEQPDAAALRWLDRQPRASVWTTAITVLEVRFGLEIMPDGRRRLARSEALRRLTDEKLERRIAPFDDAAAQATALLMGARQRRGEPRELRDSMIAGIALARRATLATRNLRHFDDAGIDLIDPWAAPKTR
ncbi:MAG: type II toxin-antitoxin system VapC family toxin [Hyphomicrobiales bacterium]